MKMSQAFPSKYLCAADLLSRNVIVTINNITMERLGNDNKPIVYFANKQKGLALNKTNGMVISIVYGDDMDMWIGKKIELFGTQVEFQGKMVDAIRVRVPTALAQPAVTDSRQDNQPSNVLPHAGGQPLPVVTGAIGTPLTNEELDDEIPF